MSYLVTGKEEFSPGRKIAYTWKRSVPESPLTFFLIHGSMANQQQYDFLLKSLEEKLGIESISHNVLTFDTMGCGQSDKADDNDYSTEKNLKFKKKLYGV